MNLYGSKSTAFMVPCRPQQSIHELCDERKASLILKHISYTREALRCFGLTWNIDVVGPRYQAEATFSFRAVWMPKSDQYFGFVPQQCVVSPHIYIQDVAFWMCPEPRRHQPAAPQEVLAAFIVLLSRFLYSWTDVCWPRNRSCVCCNQPSAALVSVDWSQKS